MNRDDSADTRFEELMAREFPTGLAPVDVSPAPPADQPPTDQPPAEPDSPNAVSPAPADSVARGWAPPEEPDEPFVPPPAPPAGRWSVAGIAGTALVVLPVVLVFATALGVRLPMLVSVLAGAGFFVGAGLLLYRLRRRPPVDGDGAVV